MIVEDETSTLGMKKVYFFGGRLNGDPANLAACPDHTAVLNLCRQVYSVTLPSAPLAASGAIPAVFERLTPTIPTLNFSQGIIFGNAVYIKS